MPSPVIAVFSMPDRGHFQRLRPVVAGLRSAGARVLVFTHEGFAREVAEDGAEFVDLFRDREIDRPGDDSWPRPVRYMTFAATWADDVVQTLQAQMDEVRTHGKDRIQTLLDDKQRAKFNKMLNELQTKKIH